MVVGGGREAANRTFFALDSSAIVTLVSPTSEARHPAVAKRIELGLINAVDREFKDSDLYNSNGSLVDMVLCCLDDTEESGRIALLCKEKRIPVNCADIPDLCGSFKFLF